MNIKEIQEKVKKVKDMKCIVFIEMIKEIRKTINEKFNGSLDFMDYETEDDEIWSPTTCWCDDFSNVYEDYHIAVITCHDNGRITLDVENDETMNIEECTFDELYEIYCAISNICDHMN